MARFRFPSWMNLPARVRLLRCRRIARKIVRAGQELRNLSDREIRGRSLSLRYRARSGESLGRLLPEAYALVTEAAARTIGIRHFRVQYLGGIALHDGCVAQMETGEGKTFTAVLPLYLNALSGRGAHLATANDYLARRDADWMRPIYQMLQVSVGTVQAGMRQDERRAAYQADVTYGTVREFGFDFLRDRLLARRRVEGEGDMFARMLGRRPGLRRDAEPVQRRLNFALFDEADNVLIDEARTPLVIGTPASDDPRTAVACFQWSAAVAPRFSESEHYRYDADRYCVELTVQGRRLLRSLPSPEPVRAVRQWHLYEYVERAIRVHRDFHRDRHYVIRDGTIVIVDEYTGRLAEGRHWSGGVHQAVEAKEGLPISLMNGHAAQISVQELCSVYPKRAGMTATAVSSAREFRKVYGLPVLPIPTNRPCLRRRLPDRVFATADEKWAAVVDEVRRMRARGRPVLVGTRSIDKSERLSERLDDAGIEHSVLNARHLAAEAEIVAGAGRSGRVTVATNMAGRGTDIVLGPAVAEAGGLHVVCTEMHDAARIDQQLAGRCARQGDPGSFRQFLSLADDVLQSGFGPQRASAISGGSQTGKSRRSAVRRLFRRAQQRVERRHYRERRLLLHQVRQRMRRHVALGQDPYLDTPG